jgi:hypothetical protein
MNTIAQMTAPVPEIMDSSSKCLDHIPIFFKIRCGYHAKGNIEILVLLTKYTIVNSAAFWDQVE